MGTRGLMGVRIDGEDKLVYCHFDSYPGGLGVNIVDDLKAMKKSLGWAKVKKLARALRLVDEDATPSAADVKRFLKSANLDVSTGEKTNWYCLLRELQGCLRKTLEEGVMTDGHGFINDSLFCEWAYVVNFDDMKLEVYRGFQRAAHTKGRYASKMPNKDGYYPCALVKSIPLDRLPKDIVKVVPQDC